MLGVERSLGRRLRITLPAIRLSPGYREDCDGQRRRRRRLYPAGAAPRNRNIRVLNAGNGRPRHQSQPDQGRLGSRPLPPRPHLGRHFGGNPPAGHIPSRTGLSRQSPRPDAGLLPDRSAQISRHARPVCGARCGTQLQRRRVQVSLYPARPVCRGCAPGCRPPHKVRGVRVDQREPVSPVGRHR